MAKLNKDTESLRKQFISHIHLEMSPLKAFGREMPFQKKDEAGSNRLWLNIGAATLDVLQSPNVNDGYGGQLSSLRSKSPFCKHCVHLPAQV